MQKKKKEKIAKEKKYEISKDKMVYNRWTWCPEQITRYGSTVLMFRWILMIIRYIPVVGIFLFFRFLYFLFHLEKKKMMNELFWYSKPTIWLYGKACLLFVSVFIVRFCIPLVRLLVKHFNYYYFCFRYSRPFYKFIIISDQ